MVAAFSFIMGLCAFPISVAAEPISFLYAVDVGTLLRNDEVQPFEGKSFRLVVTFDDQLTFVDDRADDLRVEGYGRPQYSAVPLSVPSPYPDRAEIEGHPPGGDTDLALVGFNRVDSETFGLLGRMQNTLRQTADNSNGGHAYFRTIIPQGKDASLRLQI